MDSEQKSLGGFLLKDVSDNSNTTTDVRLDDSDFKIKDIKLTGSIKIIFLLSSLVGIGYSFISNSITGILVFSVAGVFIMDMMGMLDGLKQTKKDLTKPDGYENIE